MLGAMSITHWIVVVAVLVLLFGRGRISGLLGDIGGGLKELKRAGKELTSGTPTDDEDPPQPRRLT